MQTIEYNVSTGETKEIEISQEELESYAKNNVISECSFKIKELKSQISESDYKVIKCYEYNLAGLELPYDITELHTSRQAMRDEINKLEAQISALQGE